MNYRQINTLNNDYIKLKIQEFIAEDSPMGDFSSESVFDETETALAKVEAVDNLIFAGYEVLPLFVENSFNSKVNFKNGESVKSGSILFEFEGTVLHLLKIERILLNLLQRLCGIATLTKKYTEIAKAYNVKILDTRKTMPGLRMFDKYAVSCGGGTNHRLNLSEGIMLKDNHLAASGGIKSAVEKVRLKYPNMKIEVETENISQVNEALKANAEIIMLDNMGFAIAEEAIKVIRNSSSTTFIEISGGVNLSNLEQYCKLMPDGISVGALTHSAPNSDIRLEF